MEVDAFKQGKRTVHAYYMDFSYLLREMGVEEDRFILQFIDNLNETIIRKAMKERPIAISKDTMKELAEHAMQTWRSHGQNQPLVHDLNPDNLQIYSESVQGSK